MHVHAGDAAAVCFHCRARVVPMREGSHWKVLVFLGYALICLVCVASMFLGPFLPTLVLPVLMFAGLGVMGPIHERASATPECPNCGRYFEAVPEPVESPSVATAHVTPELHPTG